MNDPDREAEGELARHPLASLLGLFETFPAEWILYRDADVIVVDKPEGISTHAPDEASRDDVYSRLLASLTETRGAFPDEEAPYLGIHQRLDRDTSGVLLFARRKAANGKLAEQFEGRKVTKTYVAVVEGPLRLPRDGVLRHRIEEGPDGTRVARPADARARETPATRSDRGRDRRSGDRPRDRSAPAGVKNTGKEAITSVVILGARGARKLVELTPKTGRTHQLRVQLAAAGAPIVGDVMYGGAPASRLMLHATRLELAHPSTGARLQIASPRPSALERALTHDRGPLDARAIELQMRAAAAKRYGVVAAGDTDALRLVNGAGDDLPGIAVDAYGDHLVVAITEELPDGARDAVLDAALALGAAGVYVKNRPKHASRIVDARREEFAPKEPLRGTAAEARFLVHEHGVPFEVHLGDGLSTGLFLDQRENRARVREWSRDARVLNLFAYTGSFSVAAALGGAASTTTVDVSRIVTTWTERNLARVGADPAKHRVVDADCFAYLADAATRRERFDLVILDPPSFATTKTSRFSADGDYRGLAALALRVLAPGGRLLACTNHRGIVTAKLRRFLHEASRDVGVEVAQMKNMPPPEDFPPQPGRESHLKCVLVRLY